MAVGSSSPNPHTIKVYCPLHKLGFSTGATPIIQCPNQSHTMATDFPNEPLWHYCCDCQHYTPGQIESAMDCQACDRRISKRFLCGECQLVSVESDSPGRRKVFSISANGAVGPVCPGCFKRSTTTPKEHPCPDYPRSFVTSRTTCPFCDQSLEPHPTFPCSVSAYRNILRSSPVTLEFDADSNLLTESAQGAYLLIKKPANYLLPIVIPIATNLSSKQDYYNTYHELFNCENPGAGEVFILSPAIVEEVEKGWLLREPGIIETKAEQVPVRVPVGPPTQPQAQKVCVKCGTSSGPEHKYCKRCGSPLQVIERVRLADTVTLDPSDVTAEGFFDTSAETPIYSTPRPQVASGPSYPLKAIFGVVGGLAILGIIVAIITSLSTSGNSVEKKLDKAITKGNLFTPSTENARDLYLQLKNSGVPDERLKSYRDRLLPPLTNRPLQMINDFMVAGSDDPPLSDWQAASQSLGWASELKPDDKTLLARCLYAQGRVAYLSKDEALALSIWSRAANADTSWPLPENGIGLIYFANKNYSTARTHYQAAIQRNPNWPYPYNNMGTAYYMQKNYYDAKGFYQKAVQLAPRWARPHSWLGDIAMKEQDYTTAVSEFSLALDPNAIGTKNMDLERIRRQLEIAQQRSTQF